MGFAPFLMMAAGTGMQALSSYRQGQYASMQAKAQAGLSQYNAEVAETNAEAVRQKSVFDQIRALKRGRRAQGSILVGHTAENAANVMAQQGFETALDVALIGYNAEVEANRMKSAAAGYRAQAGYQEASAENYETAGKIGAGTSLLTGFGSMSAMGAFPKSVDFLNMKA